MYYGGAKIVGFLVLLLFAVSCAPKEVQKAAPLVSPPANQIETSGESWQVEWEKTLKSAQKERSVVIYVAAIVQAPPLNDQVKFFKDKFGIDLVVVSGGASEWGGKLIQERKNGIFMPDILVSGLNTFFGVVKPAKVLDPIEPALILPEVRDPKAWFEGRLPWADKEQSVFTFLYYPSAMMAINTDLAKPAEVDSYMDLLNPRWKGKIAIYDPTTAGAGFNGFASLLLNKVVDEDFFRQLVKQQQPDITRDSRLQMDWLAKGRYTIALWQNSAQLTAFRQAGAPVLSIIPREGTYLSVDGAGISRVNNAPHPNAQKVFLNWLLSREGQIRLQSFLELHSARVDISTEGIDPLQLRKQGVKYYVGANSIEEWVLNEQDRYMKMSQEIFGPLLK